MGAGGGALAAGGTVGTRMGGTVVVLGLQKFGNFAICSLELELMLSLLQDWKAVVMLGAPKLDNCENLAVALALGFSLLLQGVGAVTVFGAPIFENVEILVLELVSELSVLLQDLVTSGGVGGSGRVEVAVSVLGFALSGRSTIGLSPWRTWWVGTGQ